MNDGSGLAWLLRYFPAVSEHFIHTELDAVSGVVGGPVGLFALDPAPPGPVSALASWWRVRARFVPRPHHPAVVAEALRQSGRLWALLGPDSTLHRAKDAARVLWLARELERSGVHHLHVHFAGEAAEVAWALRSVMPLTYSVTVHARDVVLPRPDAARVLSGASSIVAISHHAATAAGALVPRAAAAIRVVRLGVPAPVEPAPLPAPGSPFRAVAVGRLVPKKGWAVLLAAWSLLRAERPDAVLELVGDGPDATVLRRLASDMGLADRWVRFHGALAPEDIAALYAAGPTCAVLACHPAPDGDVDGVPVSLLEAMGAGIPAVTTLVGGIPEVIQDGSNGLLVPPGRPAMLAAALLRLGADPALRDRLGAAARATVRRDHDPRAQATALLEAIGPPVRPMPA